MKKFNKTASVDISVDAIAEMFMNSQAVNFTNAETFIEAIIGTSLEKGTLGIIIAGFMGVLPKCELPINSNVYCSHSVWDYHTESSIEHGNSESRDIGNCTIVDVNPYAKECYKIQFTRTRSNGKTYTDVMWVPINSVTVAEVIV